MKILFFRLPPHPLSRSLWVCVCLLSLTGTTIGQDVSEAAKPFVPPEPVKTVAPEFVSRVDQVPDSARVIETVIAEKPNAEQLKYFTGFAQPLRRAGGEDTEKGREALAAAIKEWQAREKQEDLSALEKFAAAEPGSAWTAGVRMNLAQRYYADGFYSKALTTWQEVWQATAGLVDQDSVDLANQAAAELALMLARVGRTDDLETHLNAISGRMFQGSTLVKLDQAREGLWAMKNRPGVSFRCGPYAMSAVAAQMGKRLGDEFLLDKETLSSKTGFSLDKLEELSTSKLKIPMQAARRTPGSRLSLPAVAHFRIGHYGALLREEGGRYLIKDPTFGNDTWMTLDAIEAECSGYFLVAEGDLPLGWEKVSKADAAHIWGKGHSGNSDPTETNPCSEGTCSGSGSSEGMAVYNFHLMLAGLHIEDTPVGYSTARGPDVFFRVHYNMKEHGQPVSMTHTNFSNLWECDWVSYLEYPATSVVPPSVTVNLRGGGAETHTDYNSTTLCYGKNRRWDTVLKRVSGNLYERHLPDGSKEEYGRVITGTMTRFYLTKVVDAQGSWVSLSYDDEVVNGVSYPTRIIRLFDALGKSTHLLYENASYPYLVTKVIDPFGRTAVFTYQMLSGAMRLTKIKDVINLESSFEYNASGQITAMETPYGKTKFTFANPMQAYGLIRWIQATDPNGDRERIEYLLNENVTGVGSEASVPSVPGALPFYNGDMDDRNTFYWDKKAMSSAAGKYDKAYIYHWLQVDGADKASGVLESEKPALENRIWYQYPGQTVTQNLGTSSQPSVIARVIEDANGNPTTAFSLMEYNAAGNLSKKVDEIGRETVFEYDAATGLDLTAVKQKKDATTYDTLQTLGSYTAWHRPQTMTDAAGQTTTYTYNSSGQPLTITNALNEVTTLVYGTVTTASDYGRLKQVTGPVAGAVTTYTYDAYGRLRTETDISGYMLTYDYDAFDRVTLITHPDATTEQFVYNRLDLFATKDRDGHWTRTWYNALRQPALTADALGRTTQMRWCKCGGLWQLVDGNNNLTTWKHDEQGRMYKKIYADGKEENFTFEPKSGRVATVTDPKGQVCTMRYNLDGSLNNVTYTGGSPATPGVSYTYDPLYPRLASMIDGSGTTDYTYHPVGSLGALQRATINGPLSGSTDLATYTYDALGRAKTRNIGAGATDNTVTWNRDALGRLSSVVNNLGTFSHAYAGQTERLDHTDLPNGQRSGYEYFTAAQGGFRLKTLHHQASVGGATVSKFDYTYTPDGTMKTWKRQFGSAGATEFRFLHDAADQITAATLVDVIIPTPPLKQQSWQYDKGGNRTSAQKDAIIGSAMHNSRNQLTATSGGGKLFIQGHTDEPAKVKVTIGATTVDATVDAANNYMAWVPVVSGTNTISVEAKDYSPNQNPNTKAWSVSVTGGTARTLTYDFNGNMTSDGTRTYEWDAENRLIKITQGGSVTEFAYDGLSRRVSETLNGTLIRRWIWCGMELCEERDGSGAVVKRFYPEGEEWVTGADAGSYYYTRDHLGSVREMTDSTAAVRVQYDYDLWGAREKLSGDLDGARGFTGHHQHSSGLILAPFRAYDAELGRWISEDSMIDAEVNEGPNLYWYVQNGPAIMLDLDGRGAQGASAGATIGSGIGFWAGGGIGLVVGGAGGTAVCPVAGTAAGAAAGSVEGAATGTLAGAAIGAAVGHAIEEIGNWMSRAHGQGERGQTGRADGTCNPFKHTKPHPTKPDKILVKDPHTGKWTEKAKPSGYPKK